MVLFVFAFHFLAFDVITVEILVISTVGKKTIRVLVTLVKIILLCLNKNS